MLWCRHRWWPAVVSLSSLVHLNPQPHKVNDDCQINAHYSPADPGLPPRQFIDFPGKIHGAGNDSEPLSPNSFQPQAYGLNKADHRVRDNSKNEQPDAVSGDSSGCLQYLVIETAVRVHVQEPENMTGYRLHVSVPYAQQHETQYKRKPTLARFKEGNTAQAEVPDQEILSIIHGFNAMLVV